ncbi:thioesterase family protein [Kribbella sp.]|uniref:thioesterase family protein n=1 Tax=Kribbella sp. TaxID=1871183 RepID=UPI002D37B63F|nr:thioesterase family protein [Kribbella sp.]HZX03076.1 thioesterase family protein [Kribbella sp.]
MRHEVTSADTALAVGSGDVEVLATPRLITWLEYAAIERTQPLLAAGQTSVGTSVRIRHRLPTRVGDTVDVTSDAPEVDGNHLQFQVRATNSAGQVIADGEHVRVIVDREQFLANVP